MVPGRSAVCSRHARKRSIKGRSSLTNIIKLKTTYTSSSTCMCGLGWNAALWENGTSVLSQFPSVPVRQVRQYAEERGGRLSNSHNNFGSERVLQLIHRASFVFEYFVLGGKFFYCSKIGRRDRSYISPFSCLVHVQRDLRNAAYALRATRSPRPGTDRGSSLFEPEGVCFRNVYTIVFEALLFLFPAGHLRECNSRRLTSFPTIAQAGNDLCLSYPPWRMLTRASPPCLITT